MNNSLKIIEPEKNIQLWRRKEIPQPFERQDIFLLECHIAGTFYTEAKSFINADTSLPIKVKLRRENDNQFDQLAILVLTEADEKLGYIPRRKNEVIARLMDTGKAFTAEIFERNIKNDWLELKIKVFLVE